MRTLVLILLVASIVPFVPTADAYACALDVENPEQYVRCEVNLITRCVSGLVSQGACPL